MNKIERVNRFDELREKLKELNSEGVPIRMKSELLFRKLKRASDKSLEEEYKRLSPEVNRLWEEFRRIEAELNDYSSWYEVEFEVEYISFNNSPVTEIKKEIIRAPIYYEVNTFKKPIDEGNPNFDDLNWILTIEIYNYKYSKFRILNIKTLAKYKK